MRALSFADACDFLFPRTSGAPDRAWSLEPTRTLLAALGHPERHLPAVHIGGTNGKGSVAAMVAEMMQAAGYRVGLFTSPHLVDVRERFTVDGVPVSPDAFAMWTTTLRPTVEAIDASFFEVTTAIACADFAARQADVAVLEVGLGGRLDSTNVITPLVAAVTNIALEHTAYLGDTLEAIAGEKAGIAKPGVPFVVGEPDPQVAGWLARDAASRGADVRPVSSSERYDGPMGMAGEHQRRNAAVALAVVEALPPAFAVPRDARARGIERARQPGRLERRGKWLFDVAHNPAGVDTLLAHLRATPLPRPLHALFGVLSDKDGRRMLDRLLTACDRVWITSPPTAPPGRVTDLAGLAAGYGDEVVVDNGFDGALTSVQEGAATVVVTGSFHTVGDAMARLPGFPPLG